jgi:hypothetical protein
MYKKECTMSWLKKLFGKPKPKPISNTDPVKEYMASIKEAGTDNGVHYTNNIELIKQLNRDKKYDEVIEVLLKSVGLTENESKKVASKLVLEDKFAFLMEGRTTSWGAAPWHYEQLAIIYLTKEVC